MGSACSCCYNWRRDADTDSQAPSLAEEERQAVETSSQYFDNREDQDSFNDRSLDALTTLVKSDNLELRRSAASTFAEITENYISPVDAKVLEPILVSSQSTDSEIQRASSAALGNLAVNNENKKLIVAMGGLGPLMKQMMSPNVEVQCNAVGCVTNSATSDETKAKIARSGALSPSTKLAKSKDMRVQRNATGASSNMTHSDENRRELVNADAIPVLVSLLSSSDPDVQYYCTTASSNIAVEPDNRLRLAQTEPHLVHHLIHLMGSNSPRIQCQAALASRNLASDVNYQAEIVRANGLPLSSKLSQSAHTSLVLASVACIRNISIHTPNESIIVDAGFLPPLIESLGKTDNEEISCHVVSSLRNLAASSERTKSQIVEAGAVEKFFELSKRVPASVESEITACIAVSALGDEIKSKLLELGIVKVLVPSTRVDNFEVQGNSAAASGNSTSKVSDYTPFVEAWTEPEGGMEGFSSAFSQSGDATFEHIATWSISQSLESEDARVVESLKHSPKIVRNVRKLAEVEAAPAGGDEPNDALYATRVAVPASASRVVSSSDAK